MTIVNPSPKHRVPWCPKSGCGMFNGASTPIDIPCRQCKFISKNDISVCPSCMKCKSCGRIAKKHYKED